MPQLIVRPVYAGTALIVDNSGDKVISLSNACFSRPFSIASWSTLRVGIRCQINGSANIVSPTFCLGVQSGNTTQIFDTNTTNAFFLRHNATPWTYSSGANANFAIADGVPGAFPTKKLVNTYTTESTRINVSTTLPGVSGSTGSPMMFSVDIIKGSPNWFIKMFQGGSTIPAAMSRATFLANMVAATPSATNYAFSNSFSQVGVPFSEVAGTIDNIAVAWSPFTATLEITDICVSKIA